MTEAGVKATWILRKREVLPDRTWEGAESSSHNKLSQICRHMIDHLRERLSPKTGMESNSPAKKIEHSLKSCPWLLSSI